MGDVLTTYREALDALFARTTGQWKLGLERMQALLHSLGDPHLRLRTFHVAGTNGKGSVCATLEALLRARGYRTAKYTSPHLVDFRERLLVDGVPVGEREVVDFIQEWTPEIERLGATFFEATTAMAFALFERAGVDVAVIEVGLGGRLDATNVITPLVAGVTSIGIDHVEYLGDTRELIAGEKAGIFKPGVPAVIGEQDPHIRDVLSRHARDRGADPIVTVNLDLPSPVPSPQSPVPAYTVSDVAVDDHGTIFTLQTPVGSRRLRTPLAGVHQATNAAVALAMLDAAGPEWTLGLEQAERALLNVSLSGRYEHTGRYIFDVAHNPAGVAVTARTLRTVGAPRPVVALLSVLADKDWRGIMRELAPVVDRFVLTLSPTSPASRAWRPADARDYAITEGWPAEAIPDFDAALARAAELGATVLVTGSFHTVGDAMSRLQSSARMDAPRLL